MLKNQRTKTLQTDLRAFDQNDASEEMGHTLCLQFTSLGGVRLVFHFCMSPGDLLLILVKIQHP